MVDMNKAFSTTVFASMFTLAAAFVTGCAADTDEVTGSAEPTESTGKTSEALAIGGGGGFGGGLTSPTCACKVKCESVYPSAPALLKACQDLCDTNNLCPSGLTRIGVSSNVIE